jgi:ferric-dicitrate binding protein FerR (iron transport regulator)
MEIDNRKIKGELLKIKELQDDIRFYKRIDVPCAYARTISVIDREQRKIRFRNVFNRVAAILFIPLFTCAFVLLYLLNHQADAFGQEVYAEVKVSPGTIMQVELPDRSRVWLNSESNLRYPVKFKGKARAVKLEGEGFFDVYTDAGRPFEVTVPSGMKVVARGTEFNLKAYGGDDENEAVLQDGMVDVAYGNFRATIRPGEMVKLDRKNSRITRSSVRTDEKTAWKDGKIIFRNTPLEEVMKQLSRRYNINITLQNRTRKSYLIRATFSTETIAQILDYLKIAAPIEWHMTKPEQNEDSTFDRQQINVIIK